MEARPPALATHVAVGPGTDAAGVAAATLRRRREFAGLAAAAAGLTQAGEPRRGLGREAGGGWRGRSSLPAAAAHPRWWPRPRAGPFGGVNHRGVPSADSRRRPATSCRRSR